MTVNLGTPGQVTTTATLYAPRMAARLYVAELGLSAARQAQALTTDTYRLDVRPIKARWVSNSWRQADELELTCSFDEAGIDPRYLRSAEVYFWLGDGGDNFVPSDSNQRFLGIVRDIAREFDTTSKVVTLRALDYTTLFLESTPFPQHKMPNFSDTLRSAYQKVCRWTGHYDFSSTTPTIISSVSDPDSSDGAFDGQPRIPLVALGDVNLDAPIGSAVNSRVAKLASMYNQTGTDAWAVWVNVCETQGLITYIRGGTCIVTQATDYYTSSTPPVFVYGSNILTLTERRDLGQVSGKHLCVRAYDGVSGTSLESFFPPINSDLAKKISKKHVLPSAKKASKAAVVHEEYEMIDLQIPCTDQALLDKITEMLWFERVRQELTGTLTTREMFVSTTDSFAGRQDFDLLSLQAGDNIYVSIGADGLDNIQSITQDSAKRGALIARGYSQDMATFIVSNLSSLTGPTALPPTFLVHSCETEFDSNNNSYNTKIEFINQLQLDGSALLNTQGAPPVTGENVISVPVTEIVGESTVIKFANPFEIVGS